MRPLAKFNNLYRKLLNPDRDTTRSRRLPPEATDMMITFRLKEKISPKSGEKTLPISSGKMGP